jgi:hypothetical protein
MIEKGGLIRKQQQQEPVFRPSSLLFLLLLLPFSAHRCKVGDSVI